MESHKRFAKGGEVEGMTVEVNSPHIQLALREVIKKYPGQNFNASPVSLSGANEIGAMACLFHYRRELEDYGKKLPDLEPRMHVLLAVQFVTKRLGQAIQRYDALPADAEGAWIAYRDLWMLFKPGDFVLTGSGHSAAMLGVVQIKYEDGEQGMMAMFGLGGSKKQLGITAAYFSHDGKHFGYRQTTITISAYAGSEQVSNLAVRPLRYHADADARRARLMLRGKRFCDLAGIHHRHYSGWASAVEHEQTQGFLFSQDRYPEERVRVDGRVMVDCAAFAEYMSNDLVMLHSVKAEGESPTDDDYAMASDRVAGFSFNEKRWCLFMVDCLSDVPFNQNAFENLLLPPGQRRLVRLLARQHTTGRDGQDSFDDMIKNKGKGCILLLHGPPGVGKTATVEAVADDIQSPVYAILSGDLGSDLAKVEANVGRIFRLVKRWKAILLIDEADVFLEKRSPGDLIRNSFVSALLRTLEYFDGIMFMTTNRFDCIDPAFQSRMHLILAYKPLDSRARRGLWRFFLQRTDGYDAKNWPDETVKGLADLDLNGRQIKNIVRTANSLAVADNRRLSTEELDIVLTTVADFKAKSLPTSCSDGAEG
ncbi:hypothetical protein MAPG_10790 [Magnaporthiopsis poae ATCC 64411]|uniref:AAA+ ATPase domain-containing protein n=1 Tax=Magnaporthiopsis poae (strain ATCC 64411 / 73-15) TaxID=644358 RepID=A0A0C4EDJ0_MAGP6|nr:hypothetical protein MAPG_10790 [Magnaporthiopsis poae ATCC 64411]